MPSEFDTFDAAFSAPHFVEQFAERDGQGDLATTIYHPPGGGNPVPLVGVIVGQLTVQLVEDEQGNAVKREAVRITIDRTINANMNRVEKKARFVVPGFGDRVWVPQQVGSRLTATELIYELERKPLSNMDGKTNDRIV